MGGASSDEEVSLISQQADRTHSVVGIESWANYERLIEDDEKLGGNLSSQNTPWACVFVCVCVIILNRLAYCVCVRCFQLMLLLGLLPSYIIEHTMTAWRLCLHWGRKCNFPSTQVGILGVQSSYDLHCAQNVQLIQSTIQCKLHPVVVMRQVFIAMWIEKTLFAIHNIRWQTENDNNFAKKGIFIASLPKKLIFNFHSTKPGTL